jgi:uncharacterized RDD family membrane protein YckC
MRCPKCHYITFGEGDRCRNCGYEFSLAEDDSLLDLPIQQDDEPIGPLADLQLTESRVESSAAASVASPMSPAADESRVTFSARSIADPDLPLFESDAPLVTPPAVPRPPLAVRRGAPQVTRPRASQVDPLAEPVLDLGTPTPQPRRKHIGLDEMPEPEPIESSQDVAPASAGARVFGAVIDAVILGSIDLAVVYFTLQLVGLRLADIRSLPLIPLVAFLLLLAGGYATMFTTAGGQTIGKMAARIRVVPSADPVHGRVPFGVSVVRSAAYLVSLAPGGLGFILALFSADGRALHDRLADTRVVKA